MYVIYNIIVYILVNVSPVQHIPSDLFFECLILYCMKIFILLNWQHLGG